MAVGRCLDYSNPGQLLQPIAFMADENRLGRSSSLEQRGRGIPTLLPLNSTRPQWSSSLKHLTESMKPEESRMVLVTIRQHVEKASDMIPT